MHSIERYGIVALLFLVVTVVAVLMWDGGNKGHGKGKGDQAAAAAPAALVPPDDSEAAARRLTLGAEARPGPLFRSPVVPQEAADAGSGSPPAGAEPSRLEASSAADATAPGSGPEPAREETVVERPFALAPTGVLAPAGNPTHAYLVRSGDTLSEIAQRELGSARRWSEILAVNPGLDPGRLCAGKTIQVPGAGPGPVAQGSQPAGPGAVPAASSGATWKVGKGESLWKIAERTLGSGARWREIAALNPGLDPDRLVQGQVLKLPGKAAGGPAPRTAAAKAASSPAKETLVANSAGAQRPQRGGKVK